MLVVSRRMRSVSLSTVTEKRSFAAEVEKYTSRIAKFMDGIMGNVKVLFSKRLKFIQEQMDKINIPDPDILDPLKEQLRVYLT